MNPGPTCPLQTWLGGWPADLDDAALREALTALVEGEGDAGAGLVAPNRPLMVAGAAPRGPEFEALARFLLAHLVTLPPVPAPKPERHSLGFGFGRRKPPPLKKDLLKPQTDERKGSWGLTSPLSWVGLAASAPTSRSATPAPVPTPTPTVAPSGLSKSVDEKAQPEPRATPRPTGAAHKPRWPSLGISYAVGNVGAVFGLSSSPKPESRLSHELGRGSGTATPAESEVSEARTGEERGGEDSKEQASENAEVAPVENDGSAGKSEEQGGEEADAPESSPEDDSAAAPEGTKLEEPPQSTAEVANPDSASSADKETSPRSSPEPTAAAEDHPAGISAAPLETTPGDTQTPTPVVAPVELPAEPATELPAEPATELHADAPSPPPAPAEALSTPARPRSLALSLDDGASVTGSQASVADLDAAIHSDVDMAWESRAIYLAGQRRRLFWIIVSF